MWSFIKFLQGEKNRFHHLRIQFYAGLGARPKQAKTIAIQLRIDNLGQRYYDGVISAMENGNGRPMKRTDNAIASRRELTVQFWNKIDMNDDPEDLNQNIQFMKNELANQIINFDNVKVSWKKTLIFDEVQYVCNVDIETNFKRMLQQLFDSFPDNSGFVNEFGALVESLRHLLNQWNFIIDKKENKRNTQITTMTSTNNDARTTPMNNLTPVGEIQIIDLPDIEEQENFSEESTYFRPVYEEQNDLSILTLPGDNQNPIQTTENVGAKEIINHFSTETMESSTSSSPIDVPLVIHIAPPSKEEEEEEITPPSQLSKVNTLCVVNAKHQIASKLTHSSSTVSKESVLATRKRPATTEEPIALLLKCSRLKKTN
ncbi:unnamed protein product [Rotaria magnacalcarata]|uniref:Uncharacterized protein n=2 Tax=Rotaria magnacalcarata TaxID=392030 RepID=A0A819J4N7_9BILA|nr:unnamed protein product [Rotaria magnacalcarata]CAF3926763.1 unnamed protein product [Rotaria magnacalcarata]